MRKVTTGDRVQILCAAKDGHGTHLDTDQTNKAPYWIRAGESRLSGSAQESVIGMKVGERKTVTLPSGRPQTLDIEVLAIQSSAVVP